MSKEENELKEVEGTVPELLRGTLAAVGSTRRSITWSTVWLLNTLRFGVWWTGPPFQTDQEGHSPPNLAPRVNGDSQKSKMTPRAQTVCAHSTEMTRSCLNIPTRATHLDVQSLLFYGEVRLGDVFGSTSPRLSVTSQEDLQQSRN